MNWWTDVGNIICDPLPDFPQGFDANYYFLLVERVYRREKCSGIDSQAGVSGYDVGIKFNISTSCS